MKPASGITVSYLAIATGLIPSVFGHGYLKELTVDGKVYHSRAPGTGAGPSSAITTVIRTVDSTHPIHLADSNISSSLPCGQGAATRSAPHSAHATPGSVLKFTWDGGNGKPWSHQYGPIITYVADCGTKYKGCIGFDSRKALWWKIDQVGKVKTPGNSWMQGKVHEGQHYEMRLPAEMPSGNYLLRHEIIALHLAEKTNGAEFYPSCSQITVTGGDGNEMIGITPKFPGGYHLSDKGIRINIWKSLGAYPFPGPKLATFSHLDDEDDPCSEYDSDDDGEDEDDDSEPVKRGLEAMVTETRSFNGEEGYAHPEPRHRARRPLSF